MESRSLKTLQLLEEIAEEKSISQRELSDSLKISLGLVNSFIKRLVKKGYCKVATIPKNRVQYVLTASGAMEKTRLTYEYIASSYQYFKSATQRVKNLYLTLQTEGNRRVIFYGAGEFAKIALLAMTGTDLKLIAVVDPKRTGMTFSGLIVKENSTLKKNKYDVVLITTTDDHRGIVKEITSIGVPTNKIRFF